MRLHGHNLYKYLISQTTSQTIGVKKESTETKVVKPQWLQEPNIVAQIVPGKGQFYSTCFLDFNIDIESGICSVAVDSKTGVVDKNKICLYCYATRLFKTRGPYKIKIIREKLFSDLKKKIPEFSVLRIGKNFECGSVEARDELLQVLELCVKYKIRPIITSKILEFDSRVADLTIQSNGVIHISIGRDEMETGAVERGFSNETRYENAKLYSLYGVRCGVRIVEDITLPAPDFIKRIINENFHILLTPLNYKDKETFMQRRKDITWDEAKSLGIFRFEHGALHPVIVHEDYQNTRERCGLINSKMMCNNCSLKTVHFSDEVGTSKKLYRQKLQEYGW